MYLQNVVIFRRMDVYLMDVHNVKNTTVESFIFVGLKFRGCQISDKLVGI